eukprot:4337640-Ditylum_brightwellii.AAC.1
MQYLVKATELIKVYDITTKLTTLAQTNEHEGEQEYKHACVNQIESDLDKAMLQAEEHISTYPPVPWTKEIHQAHQVYKYWITALFSRHNNIEETNNIEQLRNQILTSVDVYQGDITQGIKTQSNKAKNRKKHLKLIHMKEGQQNKKAGYKKSLK